MTLKLSRSDVIALHTFFRRELSKCSEKFKELEKIGQATLRHCIHNHTKKQYLIRTTLKKHYHVFLLHANAQKNLFYILNPTSSIIDSFG